TLGGGAAREGGQVLDRALARRRKGLGRREPRPVRDRRELRARLLDVRRVAAGLAGGDPVLARVARDHELDRLAPAHRARRGLDRERVEAAAREDAAIRLEMALEGRVEAGGVEVERVRVLHHELAHAQETRLRARLVAELRLELVPDLRQVAIAADLGRDLRED